MIRMTVAVVVGAVALVGCGDSGPDGVGDDAESPVSIAGTSADDQFPDVLAVEPSFDGETWRFAVTISSPYDTPERYADGWRVIGPDGTVYGEHTLTHDHAAEQPFTRTQSGVEIPPDVDEVTIEGRDQANGYGGGSMTVDLRPIRDDDPDE